MQQNNKVDRLIIASSRDMSWSKSPRRSRSCRSPSQSLFRPLIQDILLRQRRKTFFSYHDRALCSGHAVFDVAALPPIHYFFSCKASCRRKDYTAWTVFGSSLKQLMPRRSVTMLHFRSVYCSILFYFARVYLLFATFFSGVLLFYFYFFFRCLPFL